MPLFRQDLSGPLNSTVAILGPGLMGGSLAMALRRSDIAVSLWTRDAESTPAIQSALASCRICCDLETVVKDARIVVLCTPPHAIEKLGAQLAGFLPPEIPVTDAGSVKGNIVSTLEGSLGGRFIGAHPMTGSEQSGILGARSDLYDQALCLLTPTEQSDVHALATVRSFWASVGCRVREISPIEHDTAMARISHLPHAAAAALVQAALETNEEFSGLAGPGYLDSTRIACGSECLWAEIFLENWQEILAGMTALQDHLERLKGAVERQDRGAIEAFFQKARILRQKTSS